MKTFSQKLAQKRAEDKKALIIVLIAFLILSSIDSLVNLLLSFFGL